VDGRTFDCPSCHGNITLATTVAQRAAA
jgi:hypothetical protein